MGVSPEPSATESGGERPLGSPADSEGWLRLVANHVPVRGGATDLELRVTHEIGTGFPQRPSFVGKTLGEAFADHPDRDRILGGCGLALQGQACVLDIDDGRHATRVHLGPRTDPSGKVVGVIALAFDITRSTRAEGREAAGRPERILGATADTTDRVRSEEEVRTSQRLLQRVLET